MVDVSLTYSIPFNDELLNTSSEAYIQFSNQATADLTTIIASTTMTLSSTDTLVWSFQKGSTIASSKNVMLQNVTTEKSAEKQIAQSVNETSIPDITNVDIQGNI